MNVMAFNSLYRPTSKNISKGDITGPLWGESTGAQWNVVFSSQRVSKCGKRFQYGLIFHLGRRACLGEQLARQELFIFFTPLMLHFNIKLPEGATVNLEHTEHGILKPKPYQVIFESRLWNDLEYITIFYAKCY